MVKGEWKGDDYQWQMVDMQQALNPVRAQTLLTIDHSPFTINDLSLRVNSGSP
jgi:hypothetical protein